jgi:hypothetical protein
MRISANVFETGPTRRRVSKRQDLEVGGDGLISPSFPNTPAVGLKKSTMDNASADRVSKLAVPVAKNTILPDNLCELTGQISVTRSEKSKFKR